ncbi:MAG: dTMP kinase [bacterium]|nr:dTMP kinase [bacterium]
MTFEGIEGCGKSTQLALLREWMEKVDLRVLATREPGGTELGKRVRELLLGPSGGEISPIAELLLFEVDRAQHVTKVVRPELESGVHVLCDRFYDSTMAYQAFGRGLPAEKVRDLNALATKGLVPDLTFLLDIDPEEGIKRVIGESDGHVQLLLFAREGGARPPLKHQGRARKARGLDSMEAETLEFHQRVREGFLELARQEPERFCVIPPGSVEEVHARVLKAVKDAFGWNGKNSSAKTPR